jgi:hypothetical protein
LRAGAGLSLELRDVTYPLSLLDPGRRIGAGPGFQPSASKGLGRALAIALLLVMCSALMLAPAVIATVSMVLVSRMQVQTAPWVGHLKLMPALEGGRVLVTVALITKVVKTKEPE